VDAAAQADIPVREFHAPPSPQAACPATLSGHAVARLPEAQILDASALSFMPLRTAAMWRSLSTREHPYTQGYPAPHSFCFHRDFGV